MTFATTFWFVILIIVLIWYFFVTIIVAKRGFTSLRTMLGDLDDRPD